MAEEEKSTPAAESAEDAAAKETKEEEKKPEESGEEKETEESKEKPEEEGKVEETAKEEPKTRTRVGTGRCVGLVVDWKGHMGWIQPLSKIQHQQAKRHGGRVYLSQSDVLVPEESDLPPQSIKEGKVVDFFVYSDVDGLGAEECRVRSVLRLTLPHREASRKLRDTPRWSEYLLHSEYYPSFEREHGVHLRKYAWPLAFVVLELWGDQEALVKAAVKLSTPEDSQNCDVRLLIPEDDIPKVESLPGSPKVSGHVTVPRPVPCRSLMLPTEQSAEGIRAFLKVMAPPAPAAGGGA